MSDRDISGPKGAGFWAFVPRGASAVAMVYFSTLLAYIGVTFAMGFVSRSRVDPYGPEREDFFKNCADGDGRWYTEIVDDGYQYCTDRMSNAAFFPAYPAIAYVVKNVTGCRTELSLLIVSNVCMALGVVIFREYLACRFKDWCQESLDLTIAILCYFPTTMFWRMTYTESMFFLCVIGTLYAMERRCNWLLIALLAGLSTSVRTVGVALVVPLLFQLWEERTTWKSLASRVLIAVPLSFWGLAAFIVFQWVYLDEPLAFLKAQKFWEFAKIPPFPQRCLDLLMLKPIWGAYINVEPGFYAFNNPPKSYPLLNLRVWDPIYWLLAFGCLGWGYWKKWLNWRELMLGLMLLLIPYYLQGPRAGMMSCGRYSSVVFPMYIVLAGVMVTLPRWCQQTWLGFSAVGLFLYSAFFTREYFFF